jgi:hypothetical protein
MPFLALYSERSVLAGLGYMSDINEMDSYSANCLVNIKMEINKQQSEEQKKKSKRKGK